MRPDFQSTRERIIGTVMRGEGSLRELVELLLVDVSTIIRAGRSERTQTSPECAVTSPACTPHPAFGRPDRASDGAAPASAGTVSAAGTASDPRSTLRRRGDGLG